MKFIRNLFLSVIFLNGIFLSLLFCHAFDNGDFQFWNTDSVEVGLGEKFNVKLEEEFRFGDSAGTFYYNHTDLGLNYLFNDYLEFGVNYRQIFQKKNKDWDPQYEPHVNGTIKFNWNDFVFKTRSRFAYQIKESADNIWIYRNKFSLDLPYKWTPLKIQPFIADEIFYDFDVNEMNKNRAYIGFKLAFTSNLKGEVYYMHQSSKGSKWQEANILGTSIKVLF